MTVLKDLIMMVEVWSYSLMPRRMFEIVDSKVVTSGVAPAPMVIAGLMTVARQVMADGPAGHTAVQ